MERKIGALYSKEGCKFRLWAPFVKEVRLLLKDRTDPFKMDKEDDSYWYAEPDQVKPGTLYKFELDGEPFPDPASRSQPMGVHSWSEVTSSDFSWSDQGWQAPELSKLIIYELHTGTFSPSGTFAGVVEKLGHLLELGVNCIEIMPVAQFPGGRNWGYDGAYPYAVQNSYGGRQGLKELVNNCHEKGIAVILDVVYNHMGPEGNYFSYFGPYFTSRYKTPWGQALNFDDKYSDSVRNYFLANALMWLEEFHIDGLRLDAVHEIIDTGANHFLRQLSVEVDRLQKKMGRPYFLIAESDRNDRRTIDSYEQGGYGLEAQWTDDFHHSLHSLLTGEKDGYYSDYGSLWHFKNAFRKAFVYDGIYSEHRKKTVGSKTDGLDSSSFVVSIQNHDQVGNRMLGDRLTKLVSYEALKLAAGILLVSPYVPMLFMGEEFAEYHPFLYFVSHSEQDLITAVREGRKREFDYFLKQDGDFPDPQSEETFKNSKLNWDFKNEEEKALMFEYYKYLIGLRKKNTFKSLENRKFNIETNENNKYFSLLSKDSGEKLFLAFNFNPDPQTIKLANSEMESSWEYVFSSADQRWNGPKKFPQHLSPDSSIELPPTSILVYKQ